jgi:sulfur carrier protein
MQVFINGVAHECREPCTLDALLADLAIAPTSCATAVNGKFVARSSRGTHVLQPNDQVMTFAPITGG